MRQQVMCALMMAMIGIVLSACGVPSGLIGPDGETVNPNGAASDSTTVATTDDSEYSQAVQALEYVSLSVPQQQQPSTPARIYLQAYKAAKNVNGGLRRHIDQLRRLVLNRPTIRKANRRIWGPHTPTLAPYTLVFGVERVGVGTYRYLLQGKPKGAADSAYKTLFEGGLQKGVLPRRGAGKVVFHFDHARAIDPTVDEDGKAHVAYDTRGGKVWVEARFQRFRNDNGTPADAVYTYHQKPDKSGEIKIAMRSDLHHGKAGLTAEETALLHAQWLPSGAGKGAIKYSGGDLKSATLLHTECWDALYQRTFYRESNDASAAFGQIAACQL